MTQMNLLWKELAPHLSWLLVQNTPPFHLFSGPSLYGHAGIAFHIQSTLLPKCLREAEKYLSTTEWVMGRRRVLTFCGQNFTDNV
jgi:hypothetical protein